MSWRFLQRKEPDCPATILFRYSDCDHRDFRGEGRGRGRERERSQISELPSGPDEICEKQDDHESAPSLELLKEAGQYVTEYKNLKAGQQR